MIIQLTINLEKKSDKIENTETKNLTNEEILEKFGGHGERADELKNELLISQIEIDNEFAEEEIKAVKTDEINVIEQFLPKQLDATDIKNIIQQIVKETGATSPADMGKVMAAANKQLAGKADGKTIAGVVKEILKT